MPGLCPLIFLIMELCPPACCISTLEMNALADVCYHCSRCIWLPLWLVVDFPGYLLLCYMLFAKWPSSLVAVTTVTAVSAWPLPQRTQSLFSYRTGKRNIPPSWRCRVHLSVCLFQGLLPSMPLHSFLLIILILQKMSMYKKPSDFPGPPSLLPFKPPFHICVFCFSYDPLSLTGTVCMTMGIEASIGAW